MRARTASATALFALLVPAIGWLPYHLGVPSGTASASAVAGYHNGHAFLLLVALCGVGLIVFAVIARFERSTETPDLSAVERGSIQRAELALIVVLVALAYCPVALVRYAPYVEDDYWLTLLHRMDGGLRPYADFESLYGPLMIMAPALFQRVTGYSALSYGTFLWICEVSLFATLVVILQRLIPDRRKRWFALAVIAILVANTLAGLSWNGWRRFAPALILLAFTKSPLTWRTTLLTGAACGLLLAYSHDFGVLTVAAVLGLHVYLLFWERRGEAIAHAIVFGLVGLSTWIGLAIALLGGDVAAYVENALYGAARFAAEASFPFYWTLNSLCAFGLVVLLLHTVAPGISRTSGPRATRADLMLLGGLGYALPAMKSGLNRADMWHIAAPLLPAMVALLLPWPRARFLSSARATQLAHGLVVVFTITYFLALLPTGSLMAKGLVRGAIDVVGRDREERHVTLRAVSIEHERSEPRQDILDTGAFLAAPERRDRPVLLYGNAWDMDKRLGVHRIGYPTDDFLLSDDAGLELRALLMVRPDALVVLRARPYRRLLEIEEATSVSSTRPPHGARAGRGSVPFETLLPDTPMSRVLGVLSTIHYSGAQLEYEQKERRWERTVGGWLVKHSTKIAEFGDLVVLSLLEADARIEVGHRDLDGRSNHGAISSGPKEEVMHEP